MADQPHPLPSLALRVPSIYDKTLLETRIYVPHELQSVVQRIAVVAHPYATLGGNFNDHVVLNTVRILLGGGWVIGTFNFRGAGKSGGSTSWTGKPEISDYQSVLGCLIAFVQALNECSGSKPTNKTPLREEHQDLDEEIASEQRKRLKLLMAGYSYGSLIASHLPSVDDIVREINSAIAKSAEYRTCIAGLGGSGEEWGSHTTSSQEPAGIPDFSGLVLQPNYLLISPLLPPLSSLLTLSMFNFMTPRRSLLSAELPEELGELKKGNILVIYGDADVFTSATKYRKWREHWAMVSKREGLQTRTVVEIEGAGHLWTEEGVMRELARTIGRWADELSM